MLLVKMFNLDAEGREWIDVYCPSAPRLFSIFSITPVVGLIQSERARAERQPAGHG